MAKDSLQVLDELCGVGVWDAKTLQAESAVDEVPGKFALKVGCIEADFQDGGHNLSLIHI